MNHDVQRSNVMPSRRASVISEPSTAKKVPAVKRGSVVDSPKTGSQSGFYCFSVIIGSI